MTTVLAYLHNGWPAHEFMDSVIKLGHEDNFIRFALRSRANISEQRNQLLRLFLESPAEYFFSVDSDMQFPPDILKKLKRYDRPIISALIYGQNKDGSLFPVGKKFTNERGSTVEPLVMSDVSDNGLTQVAAVGMGCTLIHREVIERLGTGPLWPFAEIEKNEQVLSEDVTFCVRAEYVGFDSFIANAVKVGHVKSRVI